MAFDWTNYMKSIVNKGKIEKKFSHNISRQFNIIEFMD